MPRRAETAFPRCIAERKNALSAEACEIHFIAALLMNGNVGLVRQRTLGVLWLYRHG